MNSELRILQLGDSCCGCGACVAICPVGALSMAPDACGFDRPNLNGAACISCGRCETTCPAICKKPDDRALLVRWAYSRDDELLSQSSSGGIFGLLAQDCLKHNGVVYGASFVDNCHGVRHVRVDCLQDLDAVLRSKYLQSRVPKDVYLGVEADLRSGRRVLFSGTACQVSALKSFLSNKRVPQDLLLCVDVFCHGVSSPKLWDVWLKWKEEKLGTTATSVNLRDKETGWRSFGVRYRFDDDQSISLLASKDWYMSAFLSNLSLRPSCYSCPSRFSCGSDLSLGDFWGIEARHPDVSTVGGVSAVIIKTANGNRAFSCIEPEIVVGESSFEDVLSGNPVLTTSVKPNSKYAEFMSDLANDKPMSDMVKKWKFEPSFLSRIVSHIGAAIRMAIRALGIRRNASDS